MTPPHAHETYDEFRLPLTVDPRDLHRIRRIVRAHLLLWQLGALVDDAQKIVTELLANVYKHAGRQAVLSLQGSRGELRITVSDRSPDMPIVKEPDWDSTTGRGLFLVEALAEDWTCVPTPTGKDVQVTLVVLPEQLLRSRVSLARCTA
ncbi:ATP-binding protein [Streptomyces sp. H27-C3]|uniref:ATP-binding protein n=1 Tax=Streptomyces sp. H27-C3 TaxID=3046305 RepID=UPI0024BB94B2|nr:ATP-binding protein [Streptomyces sp. H27-C3]MDJ0463120.1 ATP-binding protein [Streptomyces sp. H27-C3]